jgi:signal peptidase II
MLHGHFPNWLPFWGGEDFLFFRPVFNFADFSISLGVGIIILNQKKYFAETIKESEKIEFAQSTPANNTTKPDPDGETGQED